MDFCMRSSSIWQLVGYALFALKVLIPVVIIIYGVIDLVKALTAGKDDAINSASRSILMRVIIGITIFFVPTIVRTVLRLVNDAVPYLNKAAACEECLLGPLGDKCKGSIDEAKKQQEDAHKQQTQDGGYSGGVAVSGCYFCTNSFTWTNSPQAGCEKVYRDMYTDTIVDANMCSEFNSDPSRAGFTNTAQIGAEDGDGGYFTESAEGSTNINKNNVIFLGDSRTGNICTEYSLNKDSGCIYAVGEGYAWLNGSRYGQMKLSHNSENPVADINNILRNNSSTKYTIVINLGINDFSGVSASTYVNKYVALAKNDWKKANVIITSIVPVSANYRNSTTFNKSISSYNDSLSSQIATAKNNNKNNTGSEGRLENLSYCDLKIVSTASNDSGVVGIYDGDYIASDGLHYTTDGAKMVYNQIKKQCLK